MITRRIKQSLNPRLALLSLLIFFLIGFFVYALYYHFSFFSILSFTLFLIILFLIPMHRRVSKKRLTTELEREEYLEKTNLLKEELHKESVAVQSIRKKIVNYSQLKGLTEKLSVSLTLTDTAKVLSSQVNYLFANGHVTSLLYLFDRQTGELAIASSLKGRTAVNIKAKKGDLFDQYVVKMMRPLLIEDTKSDFRFDVEKVPAREEIREVRSVISVPMMIGNKMMGVLRIDSPREDQFTIVDLRFLMTIGDLGAIAIENAQLYERSEELAVKDSLTGLYLRHYLLERMETEINRQLRRKAKVSFIMLDLDNFKKYNDEFGHTAGDIVLRMVAKSLSEAFRGPGYLISRYGGEEFAILLPDCSQAKAMTLAEDVRKKIETKRVVLRRMKTGITVSLGVATLPDDTQVKEELIDLADQRLYKAKAEGRNRVVGNKG